MSIVSVRGSEGTSSISASVSPQGLRHSRIGRVYPSDAVSVLIASNLRKELSGDPLFDGISFSVDRGQRLALAGQNGAGKTTLLRAIIGETTIQGGEIALQKGTRIALHDQRPPRDRGLTLREYALSGAADLVRIEQELRELEQAMARGVHDDATMRRYSEAQARLEHAGGWNWRDRAASVLRGLGFHDHDLDRQLATFSGGELTRASLGRALAGDPDLLLLDEPTNHLDVESLEWLERELTTIDAAVVLVAHDRWFLESVTTAVLELEGGRGLYFSGPVAPVAPRAGGARAGCGEVGAARRRATSSGWTDSSSGSATRSRRRSRRRRSSRRSAASSRSGRRRRGSSRTSRSAGARSASSSSSRPGRAGPSSRSKGFGSSAGGKQLLDGASLVIERGEHIALVGPNGSGKTTLLETLVGNRTPDAGVIRFGHGVEPAYFSQHDVELDERGTVLDCAVAMTGLARPQAQNLLGQVPLLRLRGAGEAGLGALGRRAPPARARGRSSHRARTSSCSTSRRTISTSRAARRSRRRSRRSPARSCSSPTTAPSSTRSPSARSRSRSRRCTPTTAAGPTSSRRARRRPRRREVVERTPKEPKAPKPRPPKKKGPTELEQVERRITTLEQHVAQLEAKLAEDWTNMDTLTEYRTSRDELQELLVRWEALFESA